MYHFFEHGPRSRILEKGDLKYIILDLLSEKPSHGYEIIRALEERFHGFYTPSAGSVYPTLQLLEDMGYVKYTEQDGKKVYSVTEEGKRFLKDREGTTNKIKGRMRDWWRDGNREDFRDIFHELRNLGMMMARKHHELDTQKMGRIKEVVRKAAHEIEDIIEKN